MLLPSAISMSNLNKIYINQSTNFNSPSWASIAGDITGITAGNGLVGDATTGDVTIDVGPSKGISVSTNRVSVDDYDAIISWSEQFSAFITSDRLG